jgi:sugar phosphate isomerase/epimerase
MRYGLCLGSRYLAEAREAGYDFIELGIGELLPEQEETAFAPVRKKLLASPIPIEAANCFLPGALKVVGPAVQLSPVRTYMETALRRAAEVGISVVVFGSGNARQAPERYSLASAIAQFTDAARMAAEIAADYGITIAIEPLSSAECNIINSELEGARVVEEVGHAHLRLLADIFHMSCQGESFANLLTVAPLLAHVHLDSFHLPALAGGRDYDAPAFFGALAHGGYQGRFSVEDHSNFLFNAENGLSLVEAFSRQLTLINQYWESAQSHEQRR